MSDITRPTCFTCLGLDSKKTPTKKKKPKPQAMTSNPPGTEDTPMEDLSEIYNDEPLVEGEVSYNNLRITTVGLLGFSPVE